jgi:hypothetical protein
MGSVIGSQLVNQILNVEVDSRLRDCELIGNLLIAVPVADKAQDLQLAGSKIVILYVLGELDCQFRWNVFLACVNRPDTIRSWACS